MYSIYMPIFNFTHLQPMITWFLLKLNLNNPKFTQFTQICLEMQTYPFAPVSLLTYEIWNKLVYGKHEIL